MPELLRAYGDALRSDQSGCGVVLLALALVVLTPLAVIAGGAVAQSIVRAWRHRVGRRLAHR